MVDPTSEVFHNCPSFFSKTSSFEQVLLQPFATHFAQMLSSVTSLPRFVQAYFGAYLISYVRPQRPWSTELIPLEIPPSVQSSYSEDRTMNKAEK